MICCENVAGIAPLFKRIIMFTTFSKHFYKKFNVTSCYGLLLVGWKSNFSDKFKLEPITINH